MTLDNNGNFDSTNIIDSATKVEQTYLSRVIIGRQNANDNRNGALDGINIDGNFVDWNENANIKLDSDDETNANSDILRYANFTDKIGDTFYYINVENSILGGTNFTDLGARNKGNGGGYDSTLSDGEIITYDVPEKLGSDEIFIFIDSDYDSSTGYMSDSIGADKLIHITGHYGIITSSTIANYNGIDNSWNWIGTTDTPAANDYNEIEILGDDGNYYLHITSWDNEVDEIEAEIYNKVTLPDDGSRAGTPDFDSVSWTALDNDPDEGFNSDIEILTVYFGSDSTYLFFKITTEASVDLGDSTFGIIIDDVSIGLSLIHI